MNLIIAGKPTERAYFHAGVGLAITDATMRGWRNHHFTGIGVARSTATAVMLFCGEPWMIRSE